MNKGGHVYILASKKYGTLYTGVTSNLKKRMHEHKNSLFEGFAKQYNVKNMVYYEQHDTIESAIHREKRLKEWKRKGKIELIENSNPYWYDLYDEIKKW